MPWSRLDDAFYTHRKVLDLSPSARWLYVAAICYCNQNLTDGEVSAGAAESVGAIKQPRKAIAELLEAGLWHRKGAGYQVHDYLKYQLSREQILKQREAAAKRQDRLRRGRGGQYEQDDLPSTVSNGVTDGVTSGEVTTAPSPFPPSGSNSHHQTTSNGGNSGAEGVDGRNPSNSDTARALAACAILGDQAFAAAEAAGKVKSSAAGYRRRCRESALADHFESAQAFAQAHQGAVPEDIAAAVASAVADELQPRKGGEVDAAAVYRAADARRRLSAEAAPLSDRVVNLGGIAAARAALTMENQDV